MYILHQLLFQGLWMRNSLKYLKNISYITCRSDQCHDLISFLNIHFYFCEFDMVTIITAIISTILCHVLQFVHSLGERFCISELFSTWFFFLFFSDFAAVFIIRQMLDLICTQQWHGPFPLLLSNN